MRRLLLAVVSAVAAVAIYPSPGNATAADALYSLNVMRQSIGLYPYQQDPQLQDRAEQIAQIMARRGIRGHIGMNKGYGAEGTGRRPFSLTGGRPDYMGRRFYACYSANRSFRYAGAAAVPGRGATYYVLLVKK